MKCLARLISISLVAVSIPGLGTCHVIRCENLALNSRDCESLCLSEETLKAVGPSYLVSIPGEVKYPTLVRQITEPIFQIVIQAPTFA